MTPYRDALMSRPVLRTARLELRRPADRDIAAIVAIAGDWEVARHLSRMPHPYGREDARFFLDEIVPAELIWAIVERNSGLVVGMIGLSAHRIPGSIELGYYIARTHWRRGLATEAGAVVTAYGAGLVGQARLRSGYFADNPASGRVLEKLGFVVLHLSERHCLTTGDRKPSIEMGFVPGGREDPQMPCATR
jgi:RimJ/RimL family protein N-acetyltransferase